MVNDAQCPITNCKEENKAMKNCNVWPMIPSLTGKDLLTKQVDALDATQEHYRTHLDAAPSIITTKISRGKTTEIYWAYFSLKNRSSCSMFLKKTISISRHKKICHEKNSTNNFFS